MVKPVLYYTLKHLGAPMLTQQEKIERLQMAIALLQDADTGIQTALGNTEACYDIHCAIESVIDDVQDAINAKEQA
jgi:hypothetical protein